MPSFYHRWTVIPPCKSGLIKIMTAHQPFKTEDLNCLLVILTWIEKVLVYIFVVVVGNLIFFIGQLILIIPSWVSQTARLLV